MREAFRLSPCANFCWADTSYFVNALLPIRLLTYVVAVVCTALTATCKLISADLLVAVLAPIVKLLDHDQPLVCPAAVIEA